MDTTDPRAYIERVKSVVASELRLLDVSAKVADTQYFNHSAVPDFVVTWPSERGERRIFLRDSYESIEASDDEHYLEKIEPVLLSLDEAAPDFDHMSSRQVQLSARTLVTDVEAIEVIGKSAGPDSSPLANLVRANFIRGARGHIDQGRAEALIDTPQLELPTESRGQQLESLITDSFFEDAAARITRTARLIDLALYATGDALREGLGSIGGKLSLAELRHLLPWLLTQREAAQNEAFWRHVGTLMTFDDLERIKDDLSGLDVSPLIHANADRWEAKWAYLGLATPYLEENDDPDQHRFWSFEGGRMGVDLGAQRILLARNGQLVKAREGLSSATWDAIREPLAGQRLASVAMHGIRRSVTVNAEQSPDVRGDVEEVTESLEDHYFVSRVTIRTLATGDTEGTTDVQVDFGGSIVHAPTGASLKDLATIAARILNYRDPASAEQMVTILGAGTEYGLTGNPSP